MDDLACWVLDQLDSDDALADDVKITVLGALEGPDGLDQALASADQPVRAAAVDDPPLVGPAKAFLRSISVEGFRGIGRATTLKLTPAPGLTVIAGRNGSGKSSFAEALEIALTGHSYRGAKRLALWREQWRNLHHSGVAAVRVDLAVEEQGQVTVAAEWAAGADVEARSSWVQRRGDKRQPGVQALGWDRDLDLYRPLLSYDEVGGLLEAEPSKLFDAIESFLGLEQLTDAGKLLAARLKDSREPQRLLKAKSDELKALLAEHVDARASTVLAQVRKRSPDLELVRRILAGTSAPDPMLATLALFARLTLPRAEEVDAAVQELVDAAAELGIAVSSGDDADRDRSALLQHALQYHEAHGGNECPVCGADTLTGEWLAATRASLRHGAEAREKLDRARRRWVEAVNGARRLITSVPGTLNAEISEITALPTAREAWQRWASAPADDALGEHLSGTWSDLSREVAAVRAEAERERDLRQDAWAQVVPQAAAWLSAAEVAAGTASTVETLDAADKWLKANTVVLRNLRLAPLASAAREIWEQLKQESNVELGAIRLEGANTRRRVDLRGRVDGADSGALAVMSQGELHALALALFIPRAASAASPFGFVVLDDPIQAMDPSKIDGFVLVLTELAKTRQVIVFTHDDRLPEAVRRTGVATHILEVTREPGSVVSVVDALDPAGRYLEDAFSVARDPGVDSGDKVRIVPQLCRMAVEAACSDRYFAAEITNGRARVEVERVWQQTIRTSARVQLVVAPGEKDLNKWVAGKPWRREALGICTSAAHSGLRSDPVGAVRTAEKLVQELRPT